MRVGAMKKQTQFKPNYSQNKPNAQKAKNECKTRQYIEL